MEGVAQERPPSRTGATGARVGSLYSEDAEELRRFAAAQGGCRSALAELVRAEQRWVRAVVWNLIKDEHLTEDVVQQVWLSVARKAHQCADVRRWRSWLYQVCRHAALDAIGEAKRWKSAPVDLPEPATSEGPSPAELTESQGHVLRAVRSLPVIYREPLVLRALEGWDYQQIADALGLPVPTVETRLVRARRLLRELLGGDPRGGAVV